MAALDGCTVTVPRGRISALIGHNGAGKTTLLRTVGTVKHTSDGTALAAGDGGMTDNMRVAPYGATYEMVAADRARA